MILLKKKKSSVEHMFIYGVFLPLRNLQPGYHQFYGEKPSFIELTNVVDAHWNCLNEAIPMCTYNICYWK